MDYCTCERCSCCGKLVAKPVQPVPQIPVYPVYPVYPWWPTYPYQPTIWPYVTTSGVMVESSNNLLYCGES